MNPNDIAKIISNEIDLRVNSFLDHQYERGVISGIALDAKTCSVKIQGSDNARLNIPYLLSYRPILNDKVLVLNIGRTGANLLIVGSLNKPDKIHYIGTDGEPVFQNGWGNYTPLSTSYNEVGFYKDSNNIVHLQGLVRQGTVVSVIFRLPAGYRPNKIHIIGTLSNNALGQVRIEADGDVVSQSPNSNTWVSLDGLTFLAEQ